MDNNKNIYVTDGQDLTEKVEELVESGVTDVTVNVNTLNYTRYQKSHDGLELHPIIDGINKAVGKKLHWLSVCKRDSVTMRSWIFYS